MDIQTSVSRYDLPVTIEPQEEGGFVATCTQWSECYAQGESIDEVTLEVTAVAQSLIELYLEEGKKIPLSKQNETITKSSVISLPVVVAV